MELNYLLEGEQIVKIENYKKDITIENQECYLAYISNFEGSVHYHKNKHFKELKIRMSDSFIKRHHLDSDYQIIKKYTFPKAIDTNSVKPFCVKTQNIVSEILENNEQGLLKRLFLESKVLELVTVQLSLKEEAHKPTFTNQNNKSLKKLYEIQHLISSNLTKQFSIQELSTHVGLNDFDLKKEFKRVFDKTIFEYATELRMNKAKELLMHTQQPIYEISETIGYKNPTHFTAAFKKKEGITPKKFRDKIII